MPEGVRRHRYTPEHDAWIREFGPHFTDRELREIFSRRFGVSLPGGSLRQRRAKLGVKALYTGRNYLVERGPVYGDQPGRFKRGAPSPRRKPPGSLKRCTQRGEMLVRVERSRRLTTDARGRKVQTHNWVPRRIVVWEKAHGPVPKSHVVLRLVDDVTDDRLEVLTLVSKAAFARLIGSNGGPAYFRTLPEDLDLRRAAVARAALAARVGEIGRR